MRLEIPLTNPGPYLTISRPVTEVVRYIKQAGCPSKYVVFTLEFAPSPDTTGVVIENRLSEEQLPPEFAAAIFKGIEEAVADSAHSGQSLSNLRITLTDGQYHEVDSSAFYFQMLAKRAFSTALKKAEPVLTYRT